MNPKDLGEILKNIQVLKDNNLLAGFEKYEDAAVYRLSETQALVFTLDVITPIVDDPYTFGQIAAANALSDIFAMGGNPLMALNIAAFPEDRLDDLELILKGGAEKVAEASAILAGGHTIKDKEPKYGLAVVGLIHPQNIIYNDSIKCLHQWHDTELESNLSNLHYINIEILRKTQESNKYKVNKGEWGKVLDNLTIHRI